MRRAACLLALAFLAAAPAAAVTPSAGDPVFDKTWCTPAFRCPASFDSESLRLMFPQILARAKACIAGSFGMPASVPYFEEGLGLDYNLCLTSKDQPKAVKGLTMVPQCCVMQSVNNPTMCQVVCTKYGVR